MSFVLTAVIYDILLGAGLAGYFVWMFAKLRAFTAWRNALVTAVQDGTPVGHIGSPSRRFGATPLYEYDVPRYVAVWLGPANARGCIVSRNDGHVLLHGDRYQPAAAVIDRKLRGTPGWDAQIRHFEGHERIAADGRRFQAWRNVWFDEYDSLRVGLVVFRNRFRARSRGTG